MFFQLRLHSRAFLLLNILAILAATVLAHASASAGVATNSIFAPQVRIKTKKQILRVGLEEYLKGVLPSEMPPSWPVEALKAQAVAARTYVMHQMAKREHLAFDVEDSVLDQVYNPLNYKRLADEERRRIDIALVETRGLYLVRPRGEVYEAFFHADCGGELEQAKNVWGDSGRAEFQRVQYVQSAGSQANLQKDVHCELSRENHWRHKISQLDLSTQLQKYFRFAKSTAQLKQNSVEQVEVSQLSSSGRVHELLFVLQSGQHVKLHSQKFREVFGFHKVKSTNFQITLEQGDLVLRGKGRGHGVGLCQSGSRFMALVGSDFMAILKKYYPEAEIYKPSMIAAAPF